MRWGGGERNSFTGVHAAVAAVMPSFCPCTNGILSTNGVGHCLLIIHAPILSIQCVFTLTKP